MAKQALISRRNLLRCGLAGTAAIPLLDSLRAEGQSETPPTRMIVFATPNGTRNDLFWPTDNGGGNLTFPEYTAPLEPHSDKLLFLDGIRHCSAVVGDNGFNGGLNGSEHARGTGGLLTARPLGTGNFQSFMATSGWGTGISLDQHLGAILNPPTRFDTLELGVHVRDSQVRGRICYSGADQPVPPREDPADVFNVLFGADATGGGSDPELDQLRAERKSVFDLTKGQISSLRGRLGAQDRIKLDAHMASIEAIESRLSGMSQGGGIDDCNVPQGSMEVDLLDDANLEVTGQLQMDLAVAALACDQTRIITIQWNYAESEHQFPFLGLSGNHHDISHAWNGDGFAKYGQIQTWFASQLAYLLAKLDEVEESNGTLLDNTVVFWGSEIGESTSHDLTRMPYVLAGGGGGVLNTGRVLDFKSSPRDNNQLLVSLGNIMGAEEMTEFGDPGGGKGPLPELLL